jgi:hypothetical protein
MACTTRELAQLTVATGFYDHPDDRDIRLTGDHGPALLDRGVQQ